MQDLENEGPNRRAGKWRTKPTANSFLTICNNEEKENKLNYKMIKITRQSIFVIENQHQIQCKFNKAYKSVH